MFQFGSKLANWLIVGLVTSLIGQPSASVGDAAKRVRRTAWAFQFDQTYGESSYLYHHTWQFQSLFQIELLLIQFFCAIVGIITDNNR